MEHLAQLFRPNAQRVSVAYVGYRHCTKRTAAPSKAFNEAWLVCGRRAGKSSILALEFATAVFTVCS
jgi:hypothetical protein